MFCVIACVNYQQIWNPNEFEYKFLNKCLVKMKESTFECIGDIKIILTP